jgi:hypothetical protein
MISERNASPEARFGTPEHPATRIEERFWRFHAENPHVYFLFDRFTREIIKRGYDQHSARDVVHRIRWETNIVTNDRDFKINDHYSPYYGRLWMRNNPVYDGLFRFRRLRNEGGVSATLNDEAANAA